MLHQWRGEDYWRPGADLNFAPPPPQKIPTNDFEMSSIQLIMCIIISALKLRICVRFAAIFYVERVAVLTMTWSYVRIAVIV